MTTLGLNLGMPAIARPAAATHRVIFSLYFGLERPSDERGRGALALVVQLRRDGQAHNMGKGNGRPRPPKRRTIDLRPGDELLCGGRWTRIASVLAYRAHWLTDSQAADRLADAAGDGYVYRL